MIDYKQIVENLDVAAVKALLGKMKIPFKDTPSALIMPTACHNEDLEQASWKLYYYKDTHIFYCYTECSCAMSIFNFLKHYYETREIEYDWFEDIYKVVLDCSNFKPGQTTPQNTYTGLNQRYYQRKNFKKIPTYPRGLLDTFVHYYPSEWLNDGISKAAMDKFDIRFSIPQNKIIIPHFNINGELIGIRGRALNEWEVENIGKYMPVQIEGKWYNHPLSLNLYGLNITQQNIKRYGICLLGEAEKFVLQMEGFDMPNCAAAVCGSSLNKFQVDILMRTCHPREIVLCFDKDVKWEKLKEMGNKYRNYCNFSYIYDRRDFLQKKDSPTDRGQKIFQKLLEERIRI